MITVNLDGTVTIDIEENILFEEYESDNETMTNAEHNAQIAARIDALRGAY